MTAHTYSTGVPGAAVLADVDADHRLRGPYSAGGAVLRALAPDLLERHADLVARHDIELLALAPELRDRITRRRASMMATAAPEERTRYFPAAYTARLANGVADLLLEYCARRGGACRLIVRHAERADPTDLELLAVLLRRAAGGPVHLEIHAGGPVPEPLAAALVRHAARTETGRDTTRPDWGDLPDPAELGLRDGPADAADYAALTDADRRVLHDRWAAELEERGEPSLALGAIPLLRERGDDPGGAGVRAAERALQHCVMQGYYEATLRLGRRVLALLDWQRDPRRCWLATVKMCTALTSLDRPAEAERLYDLAAARTTLPSVHIQAAYGRAMLQTRYYRDRRDNDRARMWINTALALAASIPEKSRRAYNLAFQENGKALVEMHSGDLAAALRLVDAGLARMGADLAPGRFDPHRSVLAYNRAQLLTRIGTPAQALDAYTAVIAMDPHHSEYYGERAGVHRALGDTARALADYTRAIELAPPYPEVHVNRADLLMELGDHAGAIADLDRALELDDRLVDAYLNRASCRLELGDAAGAVDDVTAGLALAPAHAELHCLLGTAEHQRGRIAAARRAFAETLRLDPGLVAGWVNAAVLAFDTGDPATALTYLDRALDLGDDPVIRANRGIAHAALGECAAAVADFDAALAAGDPESRTELLYRRGLARRGLGDHAGAGRDLSAAAADAGTEYGALAAAEPAARPARGGSRGR
ncbi:tetratricopeptide repeat protein [Nocardia thailandica]